MSTRARFCVAMYANSEVKVAHEPLQRTGCRGLYIMKAEDNYSVSGRGSRDQSSSDASVVTFVGMFAGN